MERLTKRELQAICRMHRDCAKCTAPSAGIKCMLELPDEHGQVAFVWPNNYPEHILDQRVEVHKGPVYRITGITPTTE